MPLTPLGYFASLAILNAQVVMQFRCGACTLKLLISKHYNNSHAEFCFTRFAARFCARQRTASHATYPS
jgi:hypothetical protein